MNELDYLREACRYAAANSGDERTQNAAVLVVGKKTVYAANHFPPGIARDAMRMSPPHKYHFIEHAERAAIYKAAASGVPTAGAVMYCPWFACTDCARAIILAGIREVVGLASVYNATPPRWAENVFIASSMLSEAGVGQRWLAGEVGVTIKYDGRDFRC
jgi:dCMP deaminase